MKYTAIVRQKVTSRIPALNTSAKPLLVDPSGKELPKDDLGAYIGTGTQKVEEISTETTVDPVTDENGNPLEAGTPEALLRSVKAHFDEYENIEVLSVKVQETKTVREISGADLAKL